MSLRDNFFSPFAAAILFFAADAVTVASFFDEVLKQFWCWVIFIFVFT
jgi:hypothetical protein